MFWTHLEYLIYVTLIFETKQHALFSKKKKKMEKPLNLNFKFYTNHTVNLFAHGQNFLNDRNNEWCEGKHPPTMNKVYTKEKPLRLLNSKEFSKCMLPNLA